jgi:ribosomal protein S18 acetylase RimI-like enzyme
MDPAAWLELNRRSMEATFSTFVRSNGGKLLRPEGVMALISPGAPERAIFNSVIYATAEAIAAAHGELAAAYAEHGCAWTVWVPEEDTATSRMLERAGHRLDAAPRAMGIELDGFPEPATGDVECSADGDHEAMCVLNDRAYGYPEGTWRRGIGKSPPPGLRIYVAYLDGEPVATVSSHDHGQDCSIWNVATDERGRGRGFATALMRRALWEGAQRDCKTSTLQATELGAPVYGRLGYADFGALGMWESRPQE